MKSIEELTKYFGYYKSNSEFQNTLKSLLISPTNYDSQTLYIVCKKSKLEIGFTNERMIREADKNKPIMGGRPIFTHFNLYPKSSHLFEMLPFEVLFSDKLDVVRKKAGLPTDSVNQNMPILGWNKMDIYSLGLIKISFNYNPEDDTIKFIQVSQREKNINESTK